MSLYAIPVFNAPHNQQQQQPTFIDPEAAKEFDCGICLQIVTDPVDIGCINGHIYCRVCISRLILERNGNNEFMCPSCRCICNIESIRKMPFIQRQINRLKIKCPNYEITPQLTTLLSQRNQNNNKNNKNKNQKMNINPAPQPKKRSRSCISVPMADSHSRSRSQSRSRSRSRSRERNRNINEEENKELKQEENISKNNETKKNTLNELNDLLLCDWIGNIGDLDTHLQTCEYEIILCEHCHIGCIRKELSKHYLICQSYPIRCKLCNDLIRRHISSLHLEFNCPKAETQCICGEKLLREQQPMHSERHCPMHLMRCDYHIYGCLNMIKRKDMQNHLKQNMANHLSLVTRQCNHLTNCYNNLNQRVQQIEQRFNLNH